MENTWVDFTLNRGPIRGAERNRIGLTLHLKARPELEEFMAAIPRGSREPVFDSWINCNAAKNLEYYSGPLARESYLYTLDGIGQGLLINDANRDPDVPRVRTTEAREYVNLSFLRLVGISSEAGVVIGLPGAFSGDYLRRFRATFPEALKRFLHDYVVPVTINLQIVNGR